MATSLTTVPDGLTEVIVWRAPEDPWKRLREASVGGAVGVVVVVVSLGGGGVGDDVKGRRKRRRAGVLFNTDAGFIRLTPFILSAD